MRRDGWREGLRTLTLLRGRGRTVLLSALAVAGLVALVILLPQLATRLGRRSGPAPPAAEQVGAVQELRRIDDLSTAFEEDTGYVRVILLLSPT